MVHVAQISFFSDLQQRRPEQLLQDWPTLAEVAEAPAAAGARVTVIQASTHHAQFERNGVSYRFLPLDEPALRRLIAETRPDVLHVSGLGFMRETLALHALAPRIPIVLQDHKDGVPRRIWRWQLARRGFAAARAVFFCAADQARPFQRLGLLTERTRVIEMPESSCRWRPQDRAAARRDSGIHGEPALLWVGHLDDNKDPLPVLEAVSLAARELPGLQLWCCYGTAPLMPEVQARIAADPNLRGRVHLLGPQPHARIETLMNAADFFVLGSHREGSGYAVMEALACGLPPLVTDIPSFRAMTANGGIGRLWPCGDAQALCGALLDLQAQSQAEQRAKARAWFDRELSPSALGRKLHAAYLELARG
ncbi:MAG TPA: glycosyltransferase family 4 protein [Burkholderiaceae bacterium]|jgi:glycosyltransferase involved in cell wall biosynthesis